MSILLLNKSVCPICHSTINEGDRYYCFPAFVININDGLFFFSDNSFHTICLNGHAHGERAKKYANLLIERIKPENRICSITGERIADQKDHFFIEYLTSNDSEYLHQFNFTHVCKRSLMNWEPRMQLIQELSKLKSDGKWQESTNQDYLESLIAQLSV